jgi:uncharacterized protein (DUF1684 family)
MGMFVKTGESITFFGNPEVMVTHDGDPVRELEMETDESGSPTILSTGSFRWFIIRRGERFGIRLRDLKHSNAEKLDSIPHFPLDLAWRVHATFEPFIQPVTIKVPNVQGTVEESPVPGLLRFQVGEQELLLYPMGDPDHLFLVFGDETSGLETYGGGRFLSIESPDENGNYIIDFNKAYNPPCAFTPFATCPLPPKENVLPIRVTAGEKAVEEFGHH